MYLNSLVPMYLNSTTLLHVPKPFIIFISVAYVEKCELQLERVYPFPVYTLQSSLKKKSEEFRYIGNSDKNSKDFWYIEESDVDSKEFRYIAHTLYLCT